MTRRKTMNVSLTAEMEAFVLDRVSSGRYRSNSEVLRAAIRLLEAQERNETMGRADDMAPHGQLAQQPIAGLSPGSSAPPAAPEPDPKAMRDDP